MAKLGKITGLIDSRIRHLKSALTSMNTATAADVGKALSPKTVADGKVTEWKFVSGGGGGTSDYADLSNKPQIEGETLSGNKTLMQLGAVNEIENNRIDKAVLGAVIPVIHDGWLVPGNTKIIEANNHCATAVFHVTVGKTYYIVSDSSYLRLALSSTEPEIGTQCNNYNVYDNYGIVSYKPIHEYMLLTYYDDREAGAKDKTDIFVMDKDYLPSQIIANYKSEDIDVLKNVIQANKFLINAIYPTQVLYNCGIATGNKKIETNSNYNVAIYPASTGYHKIITTGSRNRAADSNTIPAIGDTVSNYNTTDTNGGIINNYRSYICVEYDKNAAPPIVYPVKKWDRDPACFITPVQNIKEEVGKNISLVGKDGESFVFLTDSHYNTNNYTAPKVINQILEDVPVHVVIHGGDVMDDGAKATEINHANEFVKAFDFIKDGFLWCLGNHDENKNGHSGQSSYWLTKAEVYRTYYAKSEKDLNDFDYCYFYYDIPATKTRFIIVDIAYGSISETQKAWITDLLDNSTGKNVIICGHFMRNEDGTYTSSATWLCGLTVSYSCIKAIIHGHCHYDQDDRTDNGVCVIGVDRDGYSRLSEYNKYTASTADETQTAFDIMTVDYLTGDVFCQRLGRGKNRIERAGVTSVSGSATLTSALYGTLTWESSDTSVATVSGGVVTAVASGSAMITAYDTGRSSEVWKVTVS